MQAMHEQTEHDQPRARAGDRGQALPLIVLMFVVLCGFVGLTIDVGYGLLQKRRLQAAVDLGALSGAQELPGSAARGEATTFTRDNFALASSQQVNVDASTSCMVAGCAQHDRLRLVASTQTPTFFLRLFGVDEWTVAARGAACGPCDSSVATFDVIVVLDRSNSMSNQDMVDAKEGVRELLSYFDDDRDRVGLAVLESSDTVSPTFYGSAGSRTGCDTGGSSHPSTSYSGMTSAYTGYGGSAGAFMDGTSASTRDRWLVVPLASGTDFKNTNGTVNTSSTLVATLNCIDNKGSTPIGPAMQAAANELDQNGRDDAVKVIVYFGDGGASSMPLQRQCRQRSSTGQAWNSQAWRACTSSDGTANQDLRQWRVTGNASWYSWSSGNRDRPCADAIAQSDRAANLGFDVYTIGYGVSTDWCRPGMSNSPAKVPNIRQSTTIEEMASKDELYFEQPERGDITEVFGQIGREITAGGTRLVE